MKLSTLLTLGTATAVTAMPVVDDRTTRFLVQLNDVDQKWVTQEEKWELHRQGIRFVDKTFSSDLQASNAQAAVAYSYPKNASHVAEVKPLLDALSSDNMKRDLTKFSSFHNRYYKSTTGRQSSQWLMDQVKQVLTEAGVPGVAANFFPHPSRTQDSIIVSIPGKSKKTVILGSHQDSINHKAANPMNARAPGADDNGSGSMTILETLRRFLADPKVKAGDMPNTVEFHWYAAEEEGLLGSQAVFKQYKSQAREVVGMLAQDMTGYTKGTTDKGGPPVIGIITDYVNKDLTAFLEIVVDAYATIDFVESKCGYGCSDHASATDAGFASSFAFESKMGDDSPFIHSAKDTLSTIDWDHMVEHARLSLGFAYELAFATF